MHTNYEQDFQLNSTLPLGALLLEENITSFHEAIEFISSLPYKRVSDLDQLDLVVKEKCGTCSSKHGFLAALAHENGVLDVQVMLIYFPFYSSFVPDLTQDFQALNLDFILEAHCFLEHSGHSIDVTSNHFDVTQYYNKEQCFELKVLQPHQVGRFKQNEHEEKFKAWCKSVDVNFKEAWALRKKVIGHLVQQDLFARS